MAGSPLNPTLVGVLLQKLSTDDDFRTKFQNSPSAAMQSIGAPANFVCGPCLTSGPLASKQQIAATQAAMDSLDRGERIAHESVRNWVESWGAEGELDRPSARRA